MYQNVYEYKRAYWWLLLLAYININLSFLLFIRIFIDIESAPMRMYIQYVYIKIVSRISNILKKEKAWKIFKTFFRLKMEKMSSLCHNIKNKGIESLLTERTFAQIGETSRKGNRVLSRTAIPEKTKDSVMELATLPKGCLGVFSCKLYSN